MLQKTILKIRQKAQDKSATLGTRVNLEPSLPQTPSFEYKAMARKHNVQRIQALPVIRQPPIGQNIWPSLPRTPSLFNI